MLVTKFVRIRKFKWAAAEACFELLYVVHRVYAWRYTTIKLYRAFSMYSEEKTYL